MRRKSSRDRRESYARNRKPKRPIEPIGTEVVVETVQRTPTKSPESYFQDERFDLTPKTDYTYARSGSYSPRFLGRKYVNPNMSRYRIRGTRSGIVQGEEEDLAYEEFSDDEIVTTGKKLQDEDLDSEDSYEIVYKDGMVLRSGHSLRTLQSMIREHDAKQIDSNINNASLHINKNISQRNAVTSRKISKSAKGLRQYSQSERKRHSMSTLESDSSTYLRTKADLNARKNLSSQFDSYSRKDQNARSNLDSYSKSKSGYDMISTRGSKSYDQTDSRNSNPGYSVSTVRTTTVTEYADMDEGHEKGEKELSEKQTRSVNHRNEAQNQTVDYLYGLDSEDEYSDGSSYSTRRSSSRYGLRNGESAYSDSSTSITTTVITTITETISTITRPVVRPVWNHVGRPLWKSIGQPITSLISSFILFTLSSMWSLVSWPVSSVASGVVSVVTWLWNSGFRTVANSVIAVPFWFWRKLEYISTQLVVLDVWLFKRSRRRGCCLCLPLLLLLPLLFTFLAGTDLSSAKSAFIGFWVRDEVSEKPIITEGNQYLTQLNEEIRLMILQLQSNTQKQLTATEVEMIVRRILDPELAALRSTMEGDKNQAYGLQNQIKLDTAAELEQMSHRHDDLLATIQNLQLEINQQKQDMKEQDSDHRSKSAAHLAGLEETLAGLQAELRNLEQKYKALLLRLDDCCKNDTYLAALVHDRVNAILADAMAGHLSGNPSQDAFTHWLHSNYVSREDLDKRLGTLATDLTENVMKMIKESEKAQIAAAVAAATQQEQENKQQHVVVAGNMSGIGAEVREMIDQALFRYSADKTGLADFGLESAGGTVVSTRCSETYYRKTALVSVFGIPLWYTSNSPRTVIQPEVHPGQCWAFRGSQGYIVIQTATTIIPSGFTLEHIPKSLAPSGEIDSAPKDFTVLGLSTEYDGVGISLGNYTYDDEGKPVQFFPVQRTGEPKPFNLIELKILSNYGNQEYTCLYRFRIHGKPYKP